MVIVIYVVPHLEKLDTPTDGITVYGPFSDKETANQWLTKLYQESEGTGEWTGDFVVTKLYRPPQLKQK